MKNHFPKLILLILVLLYMACTVELDGETVGFYNFSPQSVIEIKAYSKKVNGVFNENDCVYAYTGDIKSYHYHVFDLPVSSLPKKEFYLEVRTEDGEVYSGGSFSHYGSSKIIFSVDYEVKDTIY